MKSDNMPAKNARPCGKPFSCKVRVLRERLRTESAARCGALSRSVGRLASADARACMEYGEEVAKEEALACEAMYLQHCRAALERCIAGGSAGLRFRWPDGSVTTTRFRLAPDGMVKASGLRLVA